MNQGEINGIFVALCIILSAALSGVVFAIRALARLVESHAGCVRKRFDYVNGRVDGLQADVTMLRNRLGDWPEPKRPGPGITSPSVFD